MSQKECASNYLGPFPFSEVELRNLRNYVTSLDQTPILAEALHCYGNYVLYPYGYDYEYPANIREIVSFKKEAFTARQHSRSKTNASLVEQDYSGATLMLDTAIQVGHPFSG